MFNVKVKLLSSERCPNCKKGLQKSATSLLCAECQKEYPISDGTLIMLDLVDAFYEDRFPRLTNYSIPKRLVLFKRFSMRFLKP